MKTLRAESAPMYGLFRSDFLESQQPFRLMDLPVELRLRIFEIVFEPSKHQDLSPRHPPSVAEPALLQTSRRIRKEATTIFYRTSCFRLELPESNENRKIRDYLEGEERSWLTHVEKIKKLKRVRHVCFRVRDDSDMHDLHIDLNHCSVSNWLIPSSDKTSPCPCQTPKQWTVLQWREHIANTAHQMLFPLRMMKILRDVDQCIELADKAVKHFRVRCVTKSGKLVTRISGLAYLARAARFILDARSQWVVAIGYEKDADLDVGDSGADEERSDTNEE